MGESSGEEKLRSRIREISRLHYRKGRMPSFSEMGEIVGMRSKNAVFKLVNKLERLKIVERDKKGRPKYQPIRPKKELKIGGVVTAVIRKYR